MDKLDTQVSHVAKHLPQSPETTINSSFLRMRERSWQAHLVRISPFLVLGEGVWWESSVNGIHFFDGDKDDPYRCAPMLLHFRQHSVKDIEDRQMRCWKKIVEEQIIFQYTVLRCLVLMAILLVNWYIVYNEKKGHINQVRHISSVVTQIEPTVSFTVPMDLIVTLLVKVVLPRAKMEVALFLQAQMQLNIFLLVMKRLTLLPTTRMWLTLYPSAQTELLLVMKKLTLPPQHKQISLSFSR